MSGSAGSIMRRESQLQGLHRLLVVVRSHVDDVSVASPAVGHPARGVHVHVRLAESTSFAGSSGNSATWVRSGPKGTAVSAIRFTPRLASPVRSLYASPGWSSIVA